MKSALASCLNLTYGHDRCRIARIPKGVVQAQNTWCAVGGGHRPASVDGKKRPTAVRQAEQRTALSPIDLQATTLAVTVRVVSEISVQSIWQV